MKTFSAFFLCFLFFINPLNAQVNELPSWDYRSINPIQARIGLGYYFGAQNHSFSGFLRIDYSFYKDFYSKELLEHPSGYFDSNMDVRVGFSCEVRRNLKLYDVIPSSIRPDIMSWTYLVNLNINAEALLRPINADYYKTPTSEISGTVMGLEYSLINHSNTSVFKYLSNTNGRVTLSVRHLTDKWGGKIYLQNDFWIINFFKNHIRNHDHGNTTEAGLSGYWRYNLYEPDDGLGIYYDNNKLSLDYWFQIITDRKIANNTSSAFARLGYYSVRTDSIFHGYSRMAAGLSGDFFSIKMGMLTDDLLLGRNLQRWAHQGTNHRNLKQRRNITLLPKKTIYASKFAFTKNNIQSKKIFLKQSYFQNEYLDQLTEEDIQDLSNQKTKQIFKANPKIEEDFKKQLFINKYRYKKTRVMEPTALFPWEGRREYYEKTRKSFFVDLKLFKQS